jgi:dTDP-glucose 4,6-dehydratase
MSKVLVTGALGFIGRYLVPHLKRANFDIVSLDVHVRDYSDYVRADVTSFEDLHHVFAKENVDTVIHMAGEVGRMVGEEHPQKMIYVNNIGTLNLVRLCLEHSCRLVYFSTSEVYGRLLDSDAKVEEQDIEQKGSAFITTNIYALSKLFGEAIIRHYVENYELNAVTIRPFMVYGPGEYPSKYRSAISNFIYAALTGGKITVHQGTVRAWCYISDFLDGVSIVLKHPFSGKYEAFNIGSDEYRTMKEVAEMAIAECEGKADQIEIVQPPEKFLSLTKKFSIHKIRSLGYEPKISLKEGLHRVADWQRKEVLNKPTQRISKRGSESFP